MAEDKMTRRESEDLAKLVRQRAAIAKSEVAQQMAEVAADSEQQLATIYQIDDERWNAHYERVEAAVAALNAEHHAKCAAEGVPQQFHGSAGLQWNGRGENQSASRRAELRRVMQTRLEARGKRATTEIERASVELQAELVSGSLESDKARAFLKAMPTAAQLVPKISVAEIESTARLPTKREKQVDENNRIWSALQAREASLKEE